MNKSVNDAAEIFKALGDPTRLKILKLIITKGNNLCVGKIANVLDVSQPAVSQHLKVLKNAGLVEADRQGFHVHYQVVKNSLDDFGIITAGFYKSIGTKIDAEDGCKETEEDCGKLNN